MSQCKLTSGAQDGGRRRKEGEKEGEYNDKLTLVSTAKATAGPSFPAKSSAALYMPTSCSGHRLGWNRGTRMSDLLCSVSNSCRTLLAC